MAHSDSPASAPAADSAGRTDFDWDALYVARDTPWDKGEAAPPLLDFLRTEPIQGRVLVPGCGRGYEVRALAAQGAHAVGIDIAPTGIEQARGFPRVSDERYLILDLFHLPDAFRGSFDWVVEHTCFCAIHPLRRDQYAEAVHAALKAGGLFFAIFYLNPRQYDGEYVDDAKGPPYGVRTSQLDTYFAPYFDVLREWVPERAFPGREQRELVRVLRRKGGS
ncbi:MAG: methyltransferase domain-containing protein [Verrucomicrobia bacterium]|nr:methyltransferase domain-containing protein [Verrucomicrobiota bacterium]